MRSAFLVDDHEGRWLQFLFSALAVGMGTHAAQLGVSVSAASAASDATLAFMLAGLVVGITLRVEGLLVFAFILGAIIPFRMPGSPLYAAFTASAAILITAQLKQALGLLRTPFIMIVLSTVTIFAFWSVAFFVGNAKFSFAAFLGTLACLVLVRVSMTKEVRRSHG